jgi:hypothetical protein
LGPGLERLCRCIASPGLAYDRVPRIAAGVLKLKTPWRDGTTHRAMSPLKFMRPSGAADFAAGASLPLSARRLRERPLRGAQFDAANVSEGWREVQLARKMSRRSSDLGMRARRQSQQCPESGRPAHVVATLFARRSTELGHGLATEFIRLKISSSTPVPMVSPRLT